MILVSRLSVAVTSTSVEEIAAMEIAAAPSSLKASGIMNSAGCRGAGLQHTSRELKIWEDLARRRGHTGQEGRIARRGLALLGSLQMQWRTTELIQALPSQVFLLILLPYKWRNKGLLCLSRTFLTTKTDCPLFAFRRRWALCGSHYVPLDALRYTHGKEFAVRSLSSCALFSSSVIVRHNDRWDSRGRQHLLRQCRVVRGGGS